MRSVWSFWSLWVCSGMAVLLLVIPGCKPAPKKPPPGPAAYVPVLAAMTADPKSQRPASTKDEKGLTTYTFADAGGLTGVTMTVAKDRPKAWRVVFTTPDGKLSRTSFGGATPADMPDGWFDITDGPLVGAIAHVVSPTNGEIFSAPFLLSKPFNFQEKGIMRWACETGRGGVKAITVSNFLDTCKDAVRAKLARPDTADFRSLGIVHQVLVSADCEYAWMSDVTAKNAFNAEIKNSLKCSYSPKTGLVESSVGR